MDQHGSGGRADGADAPIDAALFLEVSTALKEAFARVAEADLADDQRTRWQRRLVAITNAAKHDLARAREQLAGFDQDWQREVAS